MQVLVGDFAFDVRRDFGSTFVLYTVTPKNLM